MKKQASLITTLLVIVESMAVVGFLFLIFAVSSSTNSGKYRYHLRIQSHDPVPQSIEKAVIQVDDRGKALSFSTNEHGDVLFRVKSLLTSVTVSAPGYLTEQFALEMDSTSQNRVETLSLQPLVGEENRRKKIEWLHKALSVVDEEGETVTNAIITARTQHSIFAVQYDSEQKIYSLRLPENEYTSLRLHITAPGYVSKTDISYNEQSPVVVLSPAGNLNLPFEFRVSVFDSEENGAFSSLISSDSSVSDAPVPIAKKAIQNASIALERGAVVKENLGSFLVFSKEKENLLKIHAPGYLPQSLKISEGEKAENHYQVYLNKQALDFEHLMTVRVKNPDGKLIAASVQSTHAAVEQESAGVYHLYARNSRVTLHVFAEGYRPRKVTLDSKKSDDYTIKLTAEKQYHYQFKILSSQTRKPIQDAILTLLGNVGEQSVRTDRKGHARVDSSAAIEKVMIAAPGYITQTFSLPEKSKTKKTVEFQLRTNPMMAINRTLELTVTDEKKQLLRANVVSSDGFVRENSLGRYQIFAEDRDLKIRITAPEYEHKTINVTRKEQDKSWTVRLKKEEKGVVLNTDVGDRLILSKGVVYRVVQPIDAHTVKVYRRTDPRKGTFNDFPEGKLIGMDEFNRQIKEEKRRKNFYDENVWITVYALNRQEYFLFKNDYRKQWSEYKLVYANHR